MDILDSVLVSLERKTPGTASVINIHRAYIKELLVRYFHSKKLTAQQYETLKLQVFSGDVGDLYIACRCLKAVTNGQTTQKPKTQPTKISCIH